jgi:hypothetical protein
MDVVPDTSNQRPQRSRRPPQNRTQESPPKPRKSKSTANRPIASRSTEGARKLANKLYVSKRSRVMLLCNVNISLGLVNGSTGHVVVFIYRD